MATKRISSKITTEPVTIEELDQMYGTTTLPEGKAYRKRTPMEHFYLQRKHDVLHVSGDAGVLNTLHKGFLTQQSDLEEIAYQEFISQVKKYIYDNELEKFWS